MYNNGEQTPFLISKENDKDSLLIKMKLKNRLESYSINYPIALNNIIDTIPPLISSFQSLNNIGEIIINEPIQFLDANNSPIIFYLKDSIYHDIDYNFINPFTINFPINKEINSEIFITNLIDFYNNNINDTLSLSINSDVLLDNNIQGGNVYGSLEGQLHEGEKVVEVTLMKISEWMETEQPMISGRTGYDDMSDDHLLSPDGEYSTELGEVPAAEEKGSILQRNLFAPYLYGRYTYE